MAPMDQVPGRDETSRLVAIGRDREAASRYAADPHPEPAPHTTEETVDSTDQLDVVLPALKGVAGNVRADQMGNPTPCSEYTVRDVFNHMIGGASFFGAQFRGEAPPAEPAPGTDLAGDDPHATFNATMDALGEAVKRPGALGRTVVAPFGEVPGDVAARFLALDGMVHTWDIATATGQAYDPPEAVVTEVLGFARQAVGPEMRGTAFGPEVAAPPGATALQQLMAFTGRTV